MKPYLDVEGTRRGGRAGLDAGALHDVKMLARESNFQA